jgi:uncharacterized phage protein (TIGR01671 family)
MRENKFRAWDKDEKIMVYLDPKEIEHNADCGITMASHCFGYQVWLNFILPAENVRGTYQEDPNIDWEKLEWMQFTGLFDKNGIEIFEGDIVNPYGHPNDYAVVKWLESSWQLSWNKEDTIRKTLHDASTWGKIEVIGNVYENPEIKITKIIK